MSTRVEIHPTAKVAAYASGCSLLVVLALFGLKRLTDNDRPQRSELPANATISVAPPIDYLPIAPSDLLIPVVELSVGDASLEVNWSAALATSLHGQTEAPVEGGRVDVLTGSYAIEVDRLEKWHEAIGQAAHYGLLTKTMPVAALIVPSDNWPLSEKTRTNLLLIDDVCAMQHVKLILLRRTNN